MPASQSPHRVVSSALKFSVIANSAEARFQTPCGPLSRVPVGLSPSVHNPGFRVLSESTVMRPELGFPCPKFSLRVLAISHKPPAQLHSPHDERTLGSDRNHDSISYRC